MAIFHADPARCTRDGICVSECPVGIIELRGPEAPSISPEAEVFCRNCGHCVAVCPRGAATLATMAPDQLDAVRPDWLLGPEQVSHFLRARRSIRSFAPRLVGRNVLAQLIDVARCAPSASNRQPVHWLVIHDPAEVRRLAGLVVDWMSAGLMTRPPSARPNFERFLAQWDTGTDVICRGAPHLIVASASQDNPAWATDCVIALTYLELAATSFGLGTCWGGFFMAAARQWAPLQKALAIPEGHITCGAMMIGYARHKYYRLPLRNAARITWQGRTV